MHVVSFPLRLRTLRDLFTTIITFFGMVRAGRVVKSSASSSDATKSEMCTLISSNVGKCFASAMFETKW